MRRIRAFHLPYNTASIISHHVRGLADHDVETRSMVMDIASVHSKEGITLIDNPVAPKLSPLWVLTRLKRLTMFVRNAVWADIVHWHSGIHVLPRNLDLLIVRLLRKPGLSEWHGAEIRFPEAEFQDNPYYRIARANGYEYAEAESHAKSRFIQQEFAGVGFHFVCTGGMLQYVLSDVAAHPTTRLFHPFPVNDLTPTYPKTDVVRPVVVHAPTAPITKGTRYVRKAVERLKDSLEFDYVELQGMEWQAAQDAIASCDVFLDQFILGDHGMAAVEAMAHGKPVVCFIKESVARQLPADIPIINANADNLSSRLYQLLRDSRLRREIGMKSRDYAVRYHDISVASYELSQLYKSIIADPGGSRRQDST